MTVGVVEVGVVIDNDPLIHVPGNVAQSLGNSKYDWSFTTTPQAGAVNRIIPVPRFDATSSPHHVISEGSSVCLEGN